MFRIRYVLESPNDLGHSMNRHPRNKPFIIPTRNMFLSSVTD